MYVIRSKEPSRARGTDGDARRGQACSPQAQAGADFAGGRRRQLRGGDCPNRPGHPFQRRPDQAPFRGRQSGAGLVRGTATGRRAQADRQEEALLVATACAKPPPAANTGH